MNITGPIHSNSDQTRPTDALEAVKLDPAVLEAQITVDASLSQAGPSPEPEVPASEKEKHPAEESIKDISETTRFEEMVRLQKAALLSLAPQQLGVLLQYAGVLRRQRQINQRHLECAFCKNNGEPTSWYTSHMLKDNRGRVRCPVLRGYRCPACGATGDHAHTIKYCPENYNLDRWSR